ncbi:MAG: diguanylate cyclase, partial [Gammaproteobacteria bacterium]|nr:diguanylate cyclase [Gammaproteobacteria bacterium]
AETRLLLPMVANVYTINTAGNFVCSALPVPGETMHSTVARTLFESPDQSRDFIIGSVERGRIVDGWVLALAHMMRNEAGDYVGIVGAGVDLENFKPLNAQNEIIPGAAVGIVSSTGVILASTGSAQQRIGASISQDNADIVLGQVEGTYAGEAFDGAPTIFSFEQIAGSDWYLIVSIPESAIVAPITRLAWYRLFVALAVMALMIAATAAVARRIAKPVEEISDTIAAIRSDRSNLLVRSYGPREIREIADELNMLLQAGIKAEQSIRQSELRFRTAFQSSPDAMAITTLDSGIFLEINDGYTRMIGWSTEDVIGKTVDDINVWHYPAERTKLVQPLLQSGVCQNLEAEFITKDKRVLSGIVTAHLINLDGVVCVLSVIRDISAQKAAEERIHQLSFNDALAGLPNRRVLIDRLGQAIVANHRHGRHGALLFLDLDDFKAVNDTFGHDLGDLLLLEVAKRLQPTIQNGDTLARLSADEFAIILEELSTDPQDAAGQAELICEQIIQSLLTPIDIAQQSLQVTCCVGITLFGKQQEDAIEPLKRAELAMYQAKSAGRNIMRFFDPDMQAVVSTRTALEQDLRKAINECQIQVHYQPQTDAGGNISAVEALVRWHDPRRGMISPVDFIPLAETSGLIVPLGQHVLDIVCDQLVQWSQHAHFSVLTIAVNVSAR